jgi:hypothetical protein
MVRVLCLVSLLLLTHCSGFAMLMSGSSVALSQNIYSKAYNATNVLTIIRTEKDIKTHIIERIK